MSNLPPHILVITVDHVIENMLRRQLGELRCTVSVLPDSSQFATARFQQQPDLVLMHLVDETGYQQCADFKRSYPDLMILAISADEERALLAGADEGIAPSLPPLLLRRRVERLLGSARQQWRAAEEIFEQDNVIKLIVDPVNGSIVDANTFACIFYGYNQTEFRQKTLSDIDALPERQMMQQVFQATEGHSTYFIFNHALANGETREVEMYSCPIALNERRLLFIICHDASARLQTEQALRESEERYRTLVETTSDMIFVIAPDARIVYVSPHFERIFGWSAREWIGHVFLPLIHFDDLGLAQEIFERALKGETLSEYELRFNTARGECGIGEFVVQPQIHQSRIIGVWGTIRDVTARRRAEMAAYEQRALAEALRDTAAALNSTLDLNELFDCILTQLDRVVPGSSSNITLIQDGVASVVRSRGYAERGVEEEVMKVRLSVMDTANLRHMYETQQPFIIQDTYSYYGWILLPATASIRSHLAAPISIDNQVIGFLNIDSDTPNSFSPSDAERLQAFANQVALAIRNARLYSAIQETAIELEQRVAERTYQLARERAQLRTILEALNEGVIYDENLTIRYFNRAMMRMVGFSAEHWDQLRRIFVTSGHNDEWAAALLADIFQTISLKQSWTREMSLKGKDNEEFYASIRVTPVEDEHRQLVGAVTVIRDISQEKALQEQKARFVAHASHELRTPLTNLKTRLYLLRRQPEQFERHLDVLESVTNRMRNLVEDLLDMSRFERGIIVLKRQPIVLQRLINDLIQMQQPEAEQKGIHLTADLPEESVQIFVDVERITQVLTNLLTNALNYTARDGDVGVSMSVDTSSDKPSVYIRIKDTGIGIAPEHLRDIFQPFFRVSGSVEGTGLGLSISKEIIDLHGGDISVESELGVGSIFSIRLPLATHIAQENTKLYY